MTQFLYYVCTTTKLRIADKSSEVTNAQTPLSNTLSGILRGVSCNISPVYTANEYFNSFQHLIVLDIVCFNDYIFL